MRGMILLLGVLLVQSVFAGGKGSGRHSSGASHPAPSPALEQQSYSVTPTCTTGKLCGNACIPLDHQCGESRAAPPKSMSHGSLPAATSPNAPIQKPQTYLYEWYSPFSGMKTWSGEPPDYIGNIQPKTVCVWQESISLGCIDYLVPENRLLLQNKMAIQKQQIISWEEYKAKEAKKNSEKAEKEQKELLSKEPNEVLYVRNKARARDIDRYAMDAWQSTADKIIELQESAQLMNKYLSIGMFEAADMLAIHMRVLAASIKSPKSTLDTLMVSTVPTDHELAMHAKMAISEMGISLFTNNDTEVSRNIITYVEQLKSVVDAARKPQTPKTP